MIGRRALLGLLAAAALPGPARALVLPPEYERPRGLYVWKTLAAEAEELIAVCRRWSITHVAWSPADRPEAMAAAFARLRREGLQVSALIGDYGWLTRDGLPRRFAALLDHPELVQSLHLDIEPQLPGGWKNEAGPDLARRWLALVAEIRSLAPRGARIAADFHPEAANLSIGGRPFLTQAAALCDMVALMSYHARPERALERAATAIRRLDVPWMFAVSLGHDRAAQAGDTGGFVAGLDLLQRRLASSPRFVGLMLHDYRRLKSLTA